MIACGHRELSARFARASGDAVDYGARKLGHARSRRWKSVVGDAIPYVQARLALMNYAEAHRRGLPIGSGAVEACRSARDLGGPDRNARSSGQAPNRPKGPGNTERGADVYSHDERQDRILINTLQSS